MKITWMVNNINQVGGIEQVVCGLSNYFTEKLNYELEIVSINSLSSRVFYRLCESVKIEHCGLDWREATFTALLKIVGEKMKETNSDILITCHPTISYAVLLSKRNFKGKVVVTQHSATDSFTKKRFFMNAFLFRFADAFIVLNEEDKKQYRKMWCLAEMIPNANSNSAKTLVDYTEKVIVAAGRMEDVKGFDRLIDAFAMVTEKYPEWKLCICGSGTLEKKLKKQISDLGITDKVILPGFIKNINDYMHNASIFAISSHSEGFSLVLIEAMSHGLPVVSFDLPAVREISGGKGILIAQQDNVGEYASMLEKLLSSEELRRENGREAYEISKKYKIDSVSKMWINLFYRLLKIKAEE